MPNLAPERRSPGVVGVVGARFEPLIVVALWLGYFGLLQWSVVRFRIPIVLGLTVCAIAATMWVLRARLPKISSEAAAAALVGSAILTATVPLFTYLSGAWLGAARTILVISPIGMAALIVAGERRHWSWWPRAVAVLASLSYLAVTAVAVVGDPAPRIDVWVTLQQASDGLLTGANMYATSWVDSPGVQDAFTYLPWTAVLLAPGRWLFGDVRWALAGWVVSSFVGLWMLAGPRQRRWAAIAIALLATAPGTLTQVDQAWTEPLLFALIVWWAVLLRQAQPWWAIIPLGLAFASKQHLALLAPLLLVWDRFGWRRTLATGVLAGTLIAPWFVASPSDFLHDTVTLLATFHPIRFANTWYLLSLNVFGVTIPFWITASIILIVIATATVLVWRRQPPLSQWLAVAATVLLLANLINKQAFYNQFWLCAALLVLAGVAAVNPRVRATETVPLAERTTVP